MKAGFRALLICGSLMLTLTASADRDALLEWYQNSYGVLWKEDSWEKLDQIVSYYDDEITYYSAEAEPARYDSVAWIKESVARWRAEGWLGSDVPVIKLDMLNGHTATFKTKWRDWYEDGSEEVSCAWYMAAKKGGKWVFTQYSALDCDAHSL